MASGCRRQIVRSDGSAATVRRVRLAILVTVASGPFELSQEQHSKGQFPGDGLGEGAVRR